MTSNCTSISGYHLFVKPEYVSSNDDTAYFLDALTIRIKTFGTSNFYRILYIIFFSIDFLLLCVQFNIRVQKQNKGKDYLRLFSYFLVDWSNSA